MVSKACAIFNGFTFYKLGYGSTDMQLRLFSLFLVLAIAPPLVQALQPPFMQSRRIFEARENHVKMYSWLVWTTGAVVSELPLSIVSGSLYFVTWVSADLAISTSQLTVLFTFPFSTKHGIQPNAANHD